jgi:hypothetical protein
VGFRNHRLILAAFALSARQAASVEP